MDKLLPQDELLKDFKKEGLSYSGIERAFGLGQGTMKNWEKNGISPEGEALLNLIRCCPWLIEAAEDNYKGRLKATIKYEKAVEGLGKKA